MPPPIIKSPSPEYDEKRVLSELAESKSGEHPAYEDPWKALRSIARALKRRNNMRNVSIIAGVLGLGGGGWHGYSLHDRVSELEKQVVDLRIAQARCCPKED